MTRLRKEHLGRTSYCSGVSGTRICADVLLGLQNLFHATTERLEG